MRRTQRSIAGMLAVVVSLAGLVSCSTKEEPAAAQAPKVDRFEGELGHFEKAGAFETFISNHELKPVYIDAYLTPGPLDDESSFTPTNDTFGLDYFVLWDACEGLEPGEKPSVAAECTGTEISIDRSEGPKDSDLTFIRGTMHLKGYFVVKGCDGPHQGLMGCSLRPVNVESLM